MYSNRRVSPQLLTVDLVFSYPQIQATSPSQAFTISVINRRKFRLIGSLLLQLCHKILISPISFRSLCDKLQIFAHFAN